MNRPCLAIVAAFCLVPPAAAQDEAARGTAPSDDCAFLTRAFAETYRGIREEEGKIAEADPVNVLMYLQIQSNTLQLAEAAGCDVRPMVSIAKRQLRRYDDHGAERPPRAGRARDEGVSDPRP